MEKSFLSDEYFGYISFDPRSGSWIGKVRGQVMDTERDEEQSGQFWASLLG